MNSIEKIAIEAVEKFVTTTHILSEGFLPHNQAKLINIITNACEKCIEEHFGKPLTDEEKAQERDEDKSRFIERNFSAVYGEQIRLNWNQGTMRDWMVIVEDTVQILDLAFEKINLQE